jgi:hypothetical protein
MMLWRAAAVGTIALSSFAKASPPVPSHAAEAAPAAAVDADVLKAREAAWRAFFAGDEAPLGSLLPADFIGINMADGPLITRTVALEQSGAFRASGARLLTLDFPETRAQRYGDVMVLYGRFTAVLESGGADKATRTLSGRLTEVFLRRDGRWVHPGWHLDLASTPTPAR